MSKIRSSNWDFVVLQEQSFRATLPDERTLFYNAVATLCEAIKESGAQVVLYMTWGWRYGDTYHLNISPDYKTMQQLLIEGYTEAARQVDAIIAPVGLAWQSVRTNNPNLGGQLYKGDNYHPSDKGAFLIACVFYATLFDADPTQLDFTGSLTAEEATYLKRQVKEVYIPNVDFNADEIVDSKDVSMMLEFWHTDEPFYDIAPPPFGDGIVDVQDLILLSEHLFEDYLAMPHWRLDEESGNIAYDYPGVHDGTLHGEPLWHPAGGVIDGALQFDGVDDYISTDFILDPSVGAFSVFAWIQGGGPGQVIISQRTGAGNIWLGLDAQSGCLMTGLQPPSTGWVTTKNPLVSESIITDEQWHHVGFVWDGSYRALYVDGIEVAKDTTAQNPLKPSDGGLHIGTDKTLDVGTFFSGLIDDVHIYDIALTAEEIAALAY